MNTPATSQFHQMVLAILLFALAGCSAPESLIIYSGNGLQSAVDELTDTFGGDEGVTINVVYAGSHSLLDTIRKTSKGDIYIPGSHSYIETAGALVVASETVGMHVPTFAVDGRKQDAPRTYTELLKPGLRIATGNDRLAAIGRATEAILAAADSRQDFRPNIVVTASTASELLQLVLDGEVDAALIWKDMLQWPQASGLAEVEIPQTINQPKQISVAVLSTSRNPTLSMRFLRYASSDQGRAIFARHGF